MCSERNVFGVSKGELTSIDLTTRLVRRECRDYRGKSHTIPDDTVCITV
jgi:hypothetical protein